MRTEKPVIKQIMVLSLLVIYLSISAACVLYLPKFNPLRSVNQPTKSAKHLVLNPSRNMQHSADNLLVLLYRSYRATADTKKEAPDNSRQAPLTLFIWIIGGITLTGLLLKRQASLKKFRYSHQQVYLSHRSLRI